MKKSFKIIFNILLIGWLPFAFVAAWGSWNRTAGVIIMSIGLILCAVGSLSSLAFLNNDKFWKTQNELEDAIQRRNKEANDLEAAVQKLIDVALKLKNNELQTEESNTQKDT